MEYDERFHTMVGVFVNFTCNEGYLLDGSARVACLSDGQWGATLPKCMSIKRPSSTTTAPSLAFIAGSFSIGFAVCLLVVLVLSKYVQRRKRKCSLQLTSGRRSFSHMPGTDHQKGSLVLFFMFFNRSHWSGVFSTQTWKEEWHRRVAA